MIRRHIFFRLGTRGWISISCYPCCKSVTGTAAAPRGSTGHIYPDFDHRKRKINLDFVNDPI